MAVIEKDLSLRRWLAGSFGGTGEVGSPWVNRAIVTVILLGSLLAILETEPSLWKVQSVAFLFHLLDPLLLGFFAAEYALRFWAAGEDPRYANLKGRLKWMTRPWQVFDLALIILFLLPVFGAQVFILRLLRLGRILAILRLGRLTRAGQAITACIGERRHELCISVIAAALLLVFSAIGLYVVEGSEQPEAFGSIPRAMWWAVATLTTVGYGDVYPVTPLGRTLAGVVAFIGIGVIAIPTGIIAGAFSNVLARERHNGAEPTRE